MHPALALQPARGVGGQAASLAAGRARGDSSVQPQPGVEPLLDANQLRELPKVRPAQPLFQVGRVSMDVTVRSSEPSAGPGSRTPQRPAGPAGSYVAPPSSPTAGAGTRWHRLSGTCLGGGWSQPRGRSYRWKSCRGRWMGLCRPGWKVNRLWLMDTNSCWTTWRGSLSLCPDCSLPIGAGAGSREPSYVQALSPEHQPVFTSTLTALFLPVSLLSSLRPLWGEKVKGSRSQKDFL